MSQEILIQVIYRYKIHLAQIVQMILLLGKVLNSF